MNGGGGGASTVTDRRHRLIGIGAAMVLVAVAVILAFAGGGEDGEVPPVVDSTPHLVDAGELTDLEFTLGHEVFWAGERPPAQLELTEEAGGSVYLRYLPADVAEGDERGFLTVGTYPVVEAEAATRRFARGAGARVLAGPGDAAVVPNPESRGSVYLAYPGSELQIEVYDPDPAQALELVRSGAIRPVGEG